MFITHGIEEAVYLGQRVAVMTSRPGRIKTILEIPTELRSLGKELRSTAEFGRLRQELWSHLRDEVIGSTRRATAQADARQHQREQAR